jgi:hypothetical protein
MIRPAFVVSFFLICFYGVVIQATAQDLQLTYVEFKEDKLVVHYSLADSVIGRFYSVRLYASKDNFLNPLEKVSGGIGLKVKPGPDNTIAWDARTELGPLFDGKVSLEIRGRVFIPFINVESINQYKVFKRGRKYNITWTGGSPQNILNFDLYKGERKVITFPNLANVGHHALEFPTHVKPGKGYRFKISDSKNEEDIVYTTEFRVKRKIPLVLKVIPAIMVGSGIYWLLRPKDKEPIEPIEPDLPRPLDK